ncbi:MAG: four helix bundle protein [Candidatus Moranbacteria bacterium]|nr:four helix bundle protein [Candidatus Moranbacteria bacterium]
MEQERFLTLNKITAYKKSFALSNDIWGLVGKWDEFSKRTIGSQFVRAIDSVSANIAEGFGRYEKKDKVQFYRIARGSAYESLDWLEKSKRRKLLSEKEYGRIFLILKELPKDINTLIKYTNDHLAT